MMQVGESMRKNSNTSKAIEPLFNSAFIRIFGKEESKPLTMGLINAVLRRIGAETLDQIISIDAEHTTAEGSVECRTARMDVRIVAPGRAVDLEAQGYSEDVDNRSLLYGAQLICENTPKGAKYKDVAQAVVITLLDAPALYPEVEGFVHVCRLRWDLEGGGMADGTDRLLFVVLELSKVREKYNELSEEVLSDELLTWAYLLTNGYRNESEVEKMKSEVPDIEYFAELYGLAVDDPKVKRAYEDAVSAEREYWSRQDYYERLKREAVEAGYAEGKENGIKIGIEQGIEQGRKQVIARLRELGVDESIIAQAVDSE